MSSQQAVRLKDVPMKSVKAELTDQPQPSYLPELTDFAMKRAHGKALTAAGVLGLSESHLGRLVNDGDLKLKQLEALGATTLITLAEEILKVYSPLDTPKLKAMRLFYELRSKLDELQQLLEHVA